MDRCWWWDGRRCVVGGGFLRGGSEMDRGVEDFGIWGGVGGDVGGGGKGNESGWVVARVSAERGKREWRACGRRAYSLGCLVGGRRRLPSLGWF